MDNKQLLGKLVLAELTGFKLTPMEAVSALIQVAHQQQQEIADLRTCIADLETDVTQAFKQTGFSFKKVTRQ
jgi:hypothetical protein